MAAQSNRRTALTLSIVLAACAAACSDRTPLEAKAPVVAPPFVPAEHEPTMEEKALKENFVEATLAAGTTPAKYTAEFEDGKLIRIAEERSPPNADVLRGNYVFYGARLVEYSGASPQSDATLELRFDTQGGMTSANGSAGEPGDAEISAVRNRAQLLRSHALARKSSRDHGGAR
jgi:hypothetical protein